MKMLSKVTVALLFIGLNLYVFRYFAQAVKKPLIGDLRGHIRLGLLCMSESRGKPKCGTLVWSGFHIDLTAHMVHKLLGDC